MDINQSEMGTNQEKLARMVAKTDVNRKEIEDVKTG
jgi:hypothetical protein